MKYKITDLTPQETIKKYKICKNGIKIKYLKGSEIIPYTKDNLKEIHEIMLEQAYELIYDDNFEQKITDYQATALGLGYSHVIFNFGYFYILNKTGLSPNILFDMGIISLLSSFGYLKNSFNRKNYLEKYRLFLENKDVLKNQELGFLDPITLNNLDKKSLQKLKLVIEISKSMELRKNEKQKRLGELK